jgi:hypothetical protein
LLHYPVLGKTGEIIASAITNLDLHDIARASTTYGVQSYQVVIPLDDQRRIAEDICKHWTVGYGSRSNPDRKKSFELINITSNIDDAKNHIHQITGYSPRLIATTAKRTDGCLTYEECRQFVYSEEPTLLIFGTAWGLSKDFMKQCEHVLEPIASHRKYNHLSVRSAVSIILDRLLGDFHNKKLDF